MLRDWHQLQAHPEQSIREVIERIDRGGQKIALVLAGDRLVGTVSDGDVRRAILRNLPLEAPARLIMNTKPSTIGPQASREQAVDLMRQKRLTLVPVVDETGRILGVELFNEDFGPLERENIVVLMAGGKGLRLRPLTETVPKPLLYVGEYPILEIILRQLIAQGFREFMISVNYLGNLIRAHFGDGSRFGARIEYLVEREALGTAGALSLITRRPTTPFVVMNGDLLTRLRLDWLIEYHSGHDAEATVAVREYDFQIPFGVVETEGGLVRSIDEKPVHKLFVNAGIYVLQPTVLDKILPKQAQDMPTVLEQLRLSGSRVAAFPMRETWIDIGRPEDFQRAQAEFGSLFASQFQQDGKM